MLKEGTFLGHFEDEDIMRWGLLILLITLEGHLLSIFEGCEDVRVMQWLQHAELILEVFLLLGTAGGYCFKDDWATGRAERVDAGVVASGEEG